MPDQRPNILLIMTDQQRGDCLSVDGHPVLLTPQMDELAGGGVRFGRAYSTCPVCIPARRSLMSGQFPATHGVLAYQEGIRLDAPTLPGELAKAGYQTAIVGRNMHLSPPRDPHGFEIMRVTGAVRHGGNGEYEQWMAQHQPEGGGGYYGTGVMHNDWTARPWHMDEHLHQTTWTVNEALRFLQERDRSRPYFLVVSFLAPHPPLVPPAFYFDRYLRQPMMEPAIGDWAIPPDPAAPTPVSSDRINLTGELRRCMLAGYFGLINHVDDQIRRIINPVEKHVDANTAVMLTSDHGEMLGDHYLFRKSQPYEASARVPLIVRGARNMGLGANVVRDEPVCLEDIMPTCLDMAGVDIPESVDGRSLLPLLRGETSPKWRDVVHGEYAQRHHFLVSDRYKYIWWAKTGLEQFFDLKNDPNELRDLAQSQDLTPWRERLIEQLRDRPEGFVSDGKLVPGRPYPALMAHAKKTT